MLTLVPTPIGHLDDITLRAISVLKEADVILAEDTRSSQKLLKHHNIDSPVQSYHAFNEHKSLEAILTQIKAGRKMALISDAGTPGISDPGFLLIRGCVQEGIPVSCLPGPTAFVPALVMSGLPCDKFYFEGFLPHKKGRKTRWEYLSKLDVTCVMYESPHRIKKCIEEIIAYCGPQRQIAIAREISKIYEEVLRGSASEVLERITTSPIKGEMVVVVDKYNEKE